MSILLRTLWVLPVAVVLSAQGPRPRPLPNNAPARLRQMDPKQRKMLLESLPPERRKQAAERLDRLESLPPEERSQLERRWEQFRRLSPEDREKARDLFRDFNALPEARREALRPEFEKLRSLSPSERSSHLAGTDLKQRLSRKELQLLKRYADLPASPGM
jgi:hypothetical protein